MAHYVKRGQKRRGKFDSLVHENCGGTLYHANDDYHKCNKCRELIYIGKHTTSAELELISDKPPDLSYYDNRNY